MPLFAVVYSRRSRLSVNFIYSFCLYIAPLFVVNSFVCYIGPLGSDGNKIVSDSDSISGDLVDRSPLRQRQTQD